MSIIKKFLLKKYKGTELTFDFHSMPIESKAMCIGSCVKINGTKYWAGNIVDDIKSPITGRDCHLYIRAIYNNGPISAKDRLIAMENHFNNIPILTLSIGGFYSLNISELIPIIDIIIDDKSQSRNGKTLGKNYIHFKGTGKDNKEYEGYLTFGDAAVEDGFKKYITTIYTDINK